MWILPLLIGYVGVAVAAALFLGRFFGVTDSEAEEP
jgi:hypothetical protein